MNESDLALARSMVADEIADSPQPLRKKARDMSEPSKMFR